MNERKKLPSVVFILACTILFYRKVRLAINNRKTIINESSYRLCSPEEHFAGKQLTLKA